MATDPHIIRLPVYKRLRRPLKLLNLLFRSDLLTIFQKGPIFKIIPFLKALLVITKFKPDLIITGPLPTTIILYASFLHFLSTKLFRYSTKILINPCFHPDDSDFNHPVFFKILSASDYLWCFTEYEKIYLASKFSNLPSPVFIVKGLGVDSQFLINPSKIKFPKNPHLLFIANFSAHKRTELLIDSFVSVLSAYPHAKLSLLGQKTLYYPVIKRKINRLPLSVRGHIRILIKPSPRQIINSIDQSTLLCLPSIHESFGLVLAESLARGKPVIAAGTPQTTEVIKLLRGGLTFMTDDQSDLTSKILWLLDHRAMARQLGLSGYQSINNYLTWDKIGSSIWSKISSSFV